MKYSVTRSKQWIQEFGVAVQADNQKTQRQIFVLTIPPQVLSLIPKLAFAALFLRVKMTFLALLWLPEATFCVPVMHHNTGPAYENEGPVKPRSSPATDFITKTFPRKSRT